MHGVDGVCRNCGEDPRKIYRCQECGTPDPLDGDQEDDEETTGQHVMADGGEEIEELAVEEDATIAEFAEIAEEKTRGVDFLDELDDAELTLAELSASYVDADRMLRTFAVSAEGFDPDDYDEPADDEATDAGDVLRDLFAHAFRHQADWSEWRKTLIVFALVEGVSKATLQAAHREAADIVGPDAAADEFSEALEAAIEYRDELDQTDREVRTDGGVEHERADPRAAERIAGPDCEYEDCDAEADWLVELELRGSYVGFVCCQDCSKTNRLYARENELYRNDVTDEARGTVDVEFEEIRADGGTGRWDGLEQRVERIEDELGIDPETEAFRDAVHRIDDRSRYPLELIDIEGGDQETAPEATLSATDTMRGVDLDELREQFVALSVDGTDGDVTVMVSGLVDASAGEPELRADGLGEDLDDHTDGVGTPDGEGKDLGDAWAGGSEATAARRALREGVVECAGEDGGASVGDVIDHATKNTTAEIRIILKQLRLLLQQGDLYAPDNGTLRRTLADGSGITPADLQVGDIAATFRGPGGFDGGESQ
ncbi:hypothetical protein SAMN06269185_3312 [Natronoarchaeum philippinense]|uniref:Uncharacterized protein n=1 Tax=Natronoarchaeum philippinense TaxID=558529 RepID=A0A285PEG5_NATPI|nr:hypothetical protein [Natronoarchaeum philippinense]SNZ18261.1 hypothetical protein SAMN06269185_3312 [Natronoarchaeum philippinense]